MASPFFEASGRFAHVLLLLLLTSIYLTHVCMFAWCGVLGVVRCVVRVRSASDEQVELARLIERGIREARAIDSEVRTPPRTLCALASSRRCTSCLTPASALSAAAGGCVRMTGAVHRGRRQGVVGAL